MLQLAWRHNAGIDRHAVLPGNPYDAVVETRRDDKLRTVIQRGVSLLRAQHRTRPSNHLRHVIGDGLQAFECTICAENDLRYLEATRGQRV